MEYNELEILWKQYDEKLDNLEKLNKKLLKNTLLQKPQKKLSWMKFQSLYGVIATPIIFLVFLSPNFRVKNIDWVFILGCIITFIIVFYLFIMILRSYLILKKMDLSNDSVMKSLNEIIKLKEISNTLQKSVFIHYPVLGVGVILIGWRHSFVFSTNTIMFLSVFFVISYILNIWARRKDREKFSKLEKDILELKEYTEE